MVFLFKGASSIALIWHTYYIYVSTYRCVFSIDMRFIEKIFNVI